MMWQTWEGWQSLGSSDRARRASRESSAFTRSSSAMRRVRSAECWATRVATWAHGVSPRAWKGDDLSDLRPREPNGLRRANEGETVDHVLVVSR
jgi:hypothetical protein